MGTKPGEPVPRPEPSSPPNGLDLTKVDGGTSLYPGLVRKVLPTWISYNLR
jgi:hypothetical protein